LTASPDEISRARDIASEVQLLNIPALCGRSWKTPNLTEPHRPIARKIRKIGGIYRAWDFNE
jgi:hypothetical protein